MRTYPKAAQLIEHNRHYITGGVVSVNRVTSPQIAFALKFTLCAMWPAKSSVQSWLAGSSPLSFKYPAHFSSIAPGFKEPKGLHSKHFIWSETGIAGGVYQWETLVDAKAFYGGPWRQGIVDRIVFQPVDGGRKLFEALSVPAHVSPPPSGPWSGPSLQ